MPDVQKKPKSPSPRRLTELHKPKLPQPAAPAPSSPPTQFKTGATEPMSNFEKFVIDGISNNIAPSQILKA